MNIYPSDYDDDRPEAPWNDAAQAAADREWSEHLDAIGDPAAERIDAHLDEQDAAADMFGLEIALGFDPLSIEAEREMLRYIQTCRAFSVGLVSYQEWTRLVEERQARIDDWNQRRIAAQEVTQ